MTLTEIAEVSGPDFLDLTTDIVAAYVSHNSISLSDLPMLIVNTHAALRSLEAVAPVLVPELVPAVPIKKSVTADYLICLEDGKKFKSLKRHLRVHFGLSPEQYREKWNLPADYPMVAPNYSAARSGLARAHGLGRRPSEPVPAKPARKKLGLNFTANAAE